MYDTSNLLLLAAALAVGILIGMAIVGLRRRGDIPCGCHAWPAGFAEAAS